VEKRRESHLLFLGAEKLLHEIGDRGMEKKNSALLDCLCRRPTIAEGV